MYSKEKSPYTKVQSTFGRYKATEGSINVGKCKKDTRLLEFDQVSLFVKLQSPNSN